MTVEAVLDGDMERREMIWLGEKGGLNTHRCLR